MHICNFCRTSISQAYGGSIDDRKIYSCFKCFIQSLKPFKFDEENVYYPMIGIRDIQLEDYVVFYNNIGQELGKVYLKYYEEGFLSYLKDEIAKHTDLATEDIILVIEPYDGVLKEDSGH